VPEIELAHLFSVQVGPGDVLYMPAHWCHEVGQRNDRRNSKQEGPVVAINYWYDADHNGVVNGLKDMILNSFPTDFVRKCVLAAKEADEGEDSDY
jgi:hypothetical protein